LIDKEGKQITEQQFLAKVANSKGFIELNE